MLTHGRKRWMWAGLGLVLVASCLTQGAVITSADFSLGYGFTNAQNWNTSETSSANTSTVQGEFTFTPSVSGSMWSGGGTYFPNRVLTDSGTGGYVGDKDWSLSVTGSYSGTPVAGGKVTLNITRLSIYGSPWNFFPSTTVTFWFNETTPGHTVSSAPQAVDASPEINNPASYAQLMWDPTDFQVLGESSTRTFNLGTTAQYLALDGFEIFGTIQYETVPEPVTLALVGLGGVVGILRRR